MERLFQDKCKVNNFLSVAMRSHLRHSQSMRVLGFVETEESCCCLWASSGIRVASRRVGACSIRLRKFLDPNGTLAPSTRAQGCMCAVFGLTSKIKLRAAAMRCLLRLIA